MSPHSVEPLGMSWRKWNEVKDVAMCHHEVVMLYRHCKDQRLGYPVIRWLTGENLLHESHRGQSWQLMFQLLSASPPGRTKTEQPPSPE